MTYINIFEKYTVRMKKKKRTLCGCGKYENIKIKQKVKKKETTLPKNKTMTYEKCKIQRDKDSKNQFNNVLYIRLVIINFPLINSTLIFTHNTLQNVK